jgi:hypothetical protein
MYACERKSSAAPGRRVEVEAAGILEHARERFPRSAGKIPAVSNRAVFFGAEVPVVIGRAGVLARLRQVIPAELVEDVLVDGQSWEQGEGAPR